MNKVPTLQYKTIYLALKFFGFKNYINESIFDNSIHNIEHLLGLVHKKNVIHSQELYIIQRIAKQMHCVIEL